MVLSPQFLSNLFLTILVVGNDDVGADAIKYHRQIYPSVGAKKAFAMPSDLPADEETVIILAGLLFNSEPGHLVAKGNRFAEQIDAFKPYGSAEKIQQLRNRNHDVAPSP